MTATTDDTRIERIIRALQQAHVLLPSDYGTLARIALACLDLARCPAGAWPETRQAETRLAELGEYVGDRWHAYVTPERAVAAVQAAKGPVHSDRD